MEGVRGKGQESANQEHPRIVLLCESIEFACVLIAGQGPSPPPCLQALRLDGSLHPAGGQVKLLSSTIRAVMLPWVPISCAALPGSSAPQDVLAGSCSAPRWELSTLHFSRLLIHRSIHLLFGGQAVCFLVLFCITAVFLGPRGCHLTGTLTPHQASSPSSFPSKHPHTSSSPPYPASSPAFLDPCCPSHPTSLLRAPPAPVACVRPS